MPAEQIFREKNDDCRKQERQTKATFLMKLTSSKEKKADGEKSDGRQKNEARFYRGQKHRGNSDRRSKRNRRFVFGDKRSRDEEDDEVKIEAKEKRADSFGTNLHFSSDRLGREKKDGDENQPERRVRPIAHS